MEKIWEITKNKEKIAEKNQREKGKIENNRKKVTKYIYPKFVKVL